MTSLYTDINKRHTLYFTPANQSTEDTELKILISKELSEQCMEPLMLSLCKMNKNITQYLIYNLIKKGLK